MNRQELHTSNYNYDATAFFQRVRDLFTRDEHLLGCAIQRSALITAARGEVQHIITRLDVLPKSAAGDSAEMLDYETLLFVKETLDQQSLLNRLNLLSEKCFQVGDRTFRSTGVGFSDRYEPSRNSYSDWPARIFDISFGSVQITYEPLLHPNLKSFSTTSDAIREFFQFDQFNGSSDSRLGHIQLCLPNLNARIESLDLTENRLKVTIRGAAAPESLKLSVSCRNEAESKTIERRLDGREPTFELPFSPSELQLWLISLQSFLADFHDENHYRSAGANAVLPKQKQSSYALQSVSGIDIPITEGVGVSPTDVFMIHGHNTSVKESVARFIEKLGLKAIILHELPNQGNTIIEKFELHAEVAFAIALVTGDDEAREAGSGTDLRKRARQNVIFEFGFFVGKLGRAHVCALLEEGVEVPSDYQGVVYIPLDPGGNWKLMLVRELKVAGFDVDANRAI
jgi:Predicted nucleotide-binding protein containing TIR-like domain